jgi:calpain-15
MFNKLKEMQEKNWFGMASCRIREPGDKEKFNALGLRTSHSYSVLGVAELEKDGETHRIIHVRNPWGHYEWNGDWSDSSDMWTDELREQCGNVEANDGKFWMPYEEFP